ncbi:hypothetical protein K2173_014531 [Erythroxylum novogranatense]|uniref:UVR domain-containing protein n=1 Tax=Erythroxylum novogranatense TaxID=1862640 RepID=A0AAV8S744_9ROSI|nr:hypothetical protein K2173_014531 [Erythroxylum novogranatense]
MSWALIVEIEEKTRLKRRRRVGVRRRRRRRIQNMGESEEDNMDSLFEGMVLFSPSQLGNDKVDDDNDDDDELKKIGYGDEDDHRTSISNRASIPEQQHQKIHEALDENLFSDLTVVTPPNPNTHRQSISRKKKRGTGLRRIGYGRLDDTDDDPSSLHSPTSTYRNLQELKIQQQQDQEEVVVKKETQVQLDSSSSCSLSQSHPSLSKFEQLKTLISDKLKNARQLVASASEARKEAISRRRLAAQDLHLASSTHSQLELQLEEACEAEDFERAERISDSLSSAEKEKQALVLALKDAESHCDAMDSQMEQALNSQIAAEQECAALLFQFSKDAQENADLIRAKAQAISSDQMDQWFSSSEALEAKRIEFDIVSHLISDTRLLVHQSIQDSVEGDRNEKQFLLEEKELLANQLEELLSLVKEKERTVDERIALVVSGFQETQSSIDSKYDYLQSCLSQVHSETEALLMKRKEIDKFLAEEEACGAKLRELARVSESEAKEYEEEIQLRKTLMLSILKSQEDKLRLAKTEEKLIEDVQILQQEVCAARSSLQTKRVPELEAEKKVAAAARNFKEAARIAAEAKSLNVEKHSAKSDLENAILEMEKLEANIQNTVNKLQESEQLILSKEKEVAKARFQRFAALELGDDKEANLLLAEAEAARGRICNHSKHFISLELVSNLGKKQLAELAASVDLSFTVKRSKCCQCIHN